MTLSPAEWTAVLGLFLGAAIGAIAAATDFCTFGGILDWFRRADTRRLRSWALAAGLAVLTSQGLHRLGVVDLGQSLYRAPTVFWLGAVVGGLLFGWGMTLAGGCGLRMLTRTGSGSLRALAALLTLAICAYATQRGLLAFPRLWLERIGSVHFALPASTAFITGATLILGGGLLAWGLSHGPTRQSPRHVLSGLAIGLLIATGWAISAIAATDPFDPGPTQSLTYVAPVGSTVVYLMTASGAFPGFAETTVFGTLAGALAVQLLRRRFRWEGVTDTRDLARAMAGGAIMGTGGVLAKGCTIGQGLTGISTLAPGSILAIAAIFLGTVLTLRWERPTP